MDPFRRPDEPNAPSEAALRVLLVEDNGAVGRAIAKSLRAQGLVVSLVHTCLEARGASGAHDVGIFDITLPDGDGIHLCEELLQAGKVAAAFFCSGSVDDRLLERAARTAPVISKEATVWDLYEAIMDAAGRPHPPSGPARR